jgi:hypothetical protein
VVEAFRHGREPWTASGAYHYTVHLTENPMNTLPTKRPEPAETEPVPTWRDLGERIRDLLKDVLEGGKKIERDLEPKMLPALKRLRSEIEKLIAKLEERASRKSG